MNAYLQNVNKIEFVVTDACNGRCKHCSQGSHAAPHAYIEPRVAANAVRRIARHYDIHTVMTFGGEPLLHAEAVFAILSAARDVGVPHRQVITNGCFTKDVARIHEVAARLAAVGVSDLLVSVDAFHQEMLPIEVVRLFLLAAKENGIPARLQPAWLVSATDDNPYNEKTRKLLLSLADLQLPTGEGNVIFPEGNAAHHLAAYFAKEIPENPYREDPYDLHCISFEANGDVLGGNLYTRDILDILDAYAP